MNTQPNFRYMKTNILNNKLKKTIKTLTNHSTFFNSFSSFFYSLANRMFGFSRIPKK